MIEPSKEAVEAAQQEIESAKVKRWRGSDSRAAELGLIAEQLGIEFDGEPTFPRLVTGTVLATCLEARARWEAEIRERLEAVQRFDMSGFRMAEMEQRDRGAYMRSEDVLAIFEKGEQGD